MARPGGRLPCGGVFLLLLAAVAFLCATVNVSAYTAPGPTVNITSATRTNFCSRAEGFILGYYNLSTALAGMTISVAVQYDTSPVYFTFNNQTGTVTGGLLRVIQQEMASIGGFTFEYSLVADPNGKSGTSYMKEVLQHFDLLGVYFTDTLARRSAGIGFTQQIVDASLVLVTVEKPDLSYSLWNFLLPFSNNLWICVLFIIFFNAVLYYVVENSDKTGSFRLVTLFDGFYQMWGTFTGGNGPEPSKPSTKLLNMGYFFFMMLLLTTYTANLTSSLVVNYSMKLKSMSAANDKKSKICVLSGSAAAGVVSATYPDVRLVIDSSLKSADDIGTMFAHMRNGDCDGSVVTMIDWQTQSIRESSNPDCDLIMVDSFRAFSGAMPYLLDYTLPYCTSMVETVLSAIIVSMTADGTLQTTIDDYLTQVWSDESCGSAGSRTDSATLAAADLAGVFVVYCIFVCMAAIRFFYETYLKHFKGGLPHSDVHDDDNKARMLKYHGSAHTAPPSGLLQLRLSAVHGLPHTILDSKSVVYLKLWTTSSGHCRMLVKCSACIPEETATGQPAASALFDHCKCDLDVRNMESEFVHIDVCTGVDDVGLSAEELNDAWARARSATTSGSPSPGRILASVGRAKVACLDILSSRRAGSVVRMNAETKDSAQAMTVNLVLDQPPRLTSTSSAGEEVAATAVNMIFPLNVMIEFNQSP